MARTLWHEVIAQRQEEHAALGDRSIENLPAADPQWIDLLGMQVQHLRECIEGAASSDPRVVLVGLMGTASAWVDAMDLRSGPT